MQATRSVRSSAHAARPSIARSPIVARPLSMPSPCSSSRLVKCNGLFGLGLPEIAVIAGIAALVFGPSKLPELGKGLGQTVKSFQTAAKEFETELKAAAAPDDEPKKEGAPAAEEKKKPEA
jgi:sec-independent protein translocase protein TatA